MRVWIEENIRFLYLGTYFATSLVMKWVSKYPSSLSNNIKAINIGPFIRLHNSSVGNTSQDCYWKEIINSFYIFFLKNVFIPFS